MERMCDSGSETADDGAIVLKGMKPQVVGVLARGPVLCVR